MSLPRQLKMRPYARLMTMLGDQLIKNERIALIELIKNAYDADSPWAIVSFQGFGENYQVNQHSKIIVEDAGEGMTPEVIERHWLNPATPEKKLRKEKCPCTPKGRVMQGEKGIGRFAILKLGRTVEVVTRPAGSFLEHVIKYDFSGYDDDFLEERGKRKELFIDDLTITLLSRKPKVLLAGSTQAGIGRLDRPPHGTRVEISNLKGNWTERKVEAIARDVSRLESIFGPVNGKNKAEFEVSIYKDTCLKNYQQDYRKKFETLLHERAVFRIEKGVLDARKLEFRFHLNGSPQVLRLCDPEVSGLKVFKDRFGLRGIELDQRPIECGSFKFAFYVFDFSPNVPAKYRLDPADKGIIRDHRIYLYRDGIRVYPYGDPEDDWLRIDALRGTQSAAWFVSNDQVVGYVSISQKENPKLRDKTNREGLIEEGNATVDFVALLQTLLRYIRAKPYHRYRISLQDKARHEVFRTEQVRRNLDALKETVRDNRKAQSIIAKVAKAYDIERSYLLRRAEVTEELAGVGLSVEIASHDVMAIMNKAMTSIDALMSAALHGHIDQSALQNELQSLRGMLSFIQAQLKDVQLLFSSTKQRRKTIRIKDVLVKVERIYEKLLKKHNVNLDICEVGSPLVAKTTDAVLLQLLLNLFDNAIYWLRQAATTQRRIRIRLDGNRGQLVFADNGPGVNKDDAPYIFEPFFSGKGEEGRGLGL